MGRPTLKSNNAEFFDNHIGFYENLQIHQQYYSVFHSVASGYEKGLAEAFSIEIF